MVSSPHSLFTEDNCSMNEHIVCQLQLLNRWPKSRKSLTPSKHGQVSTSINPVDLECHEMIYSRIVPPILASQRFLLGLPLKCNLLLHFYHLTSLVRYPTANENDSRHRFKLSLKQQPWDCHFTPPGRLL